MPEVILLNLNLLFLNYADETKKKKEYEKMVNDLINSYKRIGSAHYDKSQIRVHVTDKNAVPHIRRFLSQYTKEHIALLYISSRGWEVL